MNSNNFKEKEIMNLLKERHMMYANIDPKKELRDPYWMYNSPLDEEDYKEWIEFGVNTVISILGIDRRKAEMEMSWIESKYGMKKKIKY